MTLTRCDRTLVSVSLSVRCCFELSGLRKQPESKHPQAVLAKNEKARAKVLTGNIKSASIRIIQISLLLICVNQRQSLVICGKEILFFNRRYRQINTEKRR